MLRKSGGSITLLILPGALLTFGAPVVHAQAEPTDPAGWSAHRARTIGDPGVRTSPDCSLAAR